MRQTGDTGILQRVALLCISLLLTQDLLKRSQDELRYVLPNDGLTQDHGQVDTSLARIACTSESAVTSVGRACIPCDPINCFSHASIALLRSFWHFGFPFQAKPHVFSLYRRFAGGTSALA